MGIYIQNHRTWSERSRVFNWKNHCRTNLFQQSYLPEVFQQRLRQKNNDGWILIKSFFPSSCPCTRVGKPSSCTCTRVGEPSSCTCARVGKLSSCLGEKTGTRSSQRRKIHLLAETQIWVSGRLGSCCILPVNGPITAIYSKIFFLFSWRYFSRKYFFLFSLLECCYQTCLCGRWGSPPENDAGYGERQIMLWRETNNVMERDK